MKASMYLKGGWHARNTNSHTVTETYVLASDSSGGLSGICFNHSSRLGKIPAFS